MKMKYIGVLLLVTLALLLGCAPAETIMAPAIETSPSLVTSEEQEQVIKDLAYIKVVVLGYSDDADAEDEGISIAIFYYDSKSELINFENIPTTVTIRLYGYKDILELLQHDKMEFIGETQVTVDHSMQLSEMLIKYIRIPFENITVDQDKYYESGTIKVTVTTPEQGDFEATVDMVTLYTGD